MWEEFFMFIYSVKGSTVKFVGVTAIALAALIALLVFIPQAQAQLPGESENIAVNEKVTFDNIRTLGDRVEFLRQFGWEIDTSSEKDAQVTVPSSFDKIYQAYNELQKKQGFDLCEYSGKTVDRYTYKITNYPAYDGVVFVNVIVYKNTVIGGDVCTEDKSGFIHGFDKNTLI